MNPKTTTHALVLYITMMIIAHIFRLVVILSFINAFFFGIPMWYQYIIFVLWCGILYATHYQNLYRSLWKKTYFGDVPHQSIEYVHTLAGQVLFCCGFFPILDMVRQFGATTRNTNHTLENIPEMCIGAGICIIGGIIADFFSKKVQRKFEGPYPQLMWRSKVDE
jgi:hypothetical protein